jgi:predicted DNA-binding protein
MAIVTLRLNDEEEKILELLVKYFDADKSKILKEAMWDKYEDLRDQEIIEEFEKKERAGKVKFESADDLIQAISQKKKTKK